jgi:hypothetical protein
VTAHRSILYFALGAFVLWGCDDATPSDAPDAGAPAAADAGTDAGTDGTEDAGTDGTEDAGASDAGPPMPDAGPPIEPSSLTIVSDITIVTLEAVTVEGAPLELQALFAIPREEDFRRAGLYAFGAPSLYRLQDLQLGSRTAVFAEVGPIPSLDEETQWFYGRFGPLEGDRVWAVSGGQAFAVDLDTLTLAPPRVLQLQGGATFAGTSYVSVQLPGLPGRLHAVDGVTERFYRFDDLAGVFVEHAFNGLPVQTAECDTGRAITPNLVFAAGGTGSTLQNADGEALAVIAGEEVFSLQRVGTTTCFAEGRPVEASNRDVIAPTAAVGVDLLGAAVSEPVFLQ